MRKKLIVVVVALLVLGGAVGFRFLQLLPYPKGQFNWVASPNSRHRAYVYELTDMGFFGGTRKLYRLKVEIGIQDGKRMPVFVRDVAPRQVTVAVNLNELEPVVWWSPDSAKVIYKLGGTNITVDVPL